MKRGRIKFSFFLALAWLIFMEYAKSHMGVLFPMVSAPHRAFMVVGLIFNLVAVSKGMGWPCIVTGVMYTIASVLMLPLGTFILFPATAAILMYTAAKPATPQPEAEKVVHVYHHYEDGREVVEEAPEEENHTNDE